MGIWLRDWTFRSGGPGFGIGVYDMGVEWKFVITHHMDYALCKSCNIYLRGTK